MIRLVLQVTKLTDAGEITDRRFKTFDIEMKELEEELARFDTFLVGAEVIEDEAPEVDLS